MRVAVTRYLSKRQTNSQADKCQSNSYHEEPITGCPVAPILWMPLSRAAAGDATLLHIFGKNCPASIAAVHLHSPPKGASRGRFLRRAPRPKDPRVDRRHQTGRGSDWSASP